MSNSVNNADIEDMRLSMFEFMAMNNPVRKFIQEHIEFKTFNQYLEKRDINLYRKIIMDVGCGSGYSTELILKKYTPSKLIAFDLMPEQISLAKKRNIPVDFYVGDATKINISDQSSWCSICFRSRAPYSLVAEGVG